MRKQPSQKKLSYDLEISDKDVYEAMKEIPGYLDITTGDFKEIYRLAYRQTLERISQSVKAADLMTEEVAAVKRGTPLRDVAKLMAEQGVSGVPVLEEDKKVAGVISEKDFFSGMGGKGASTFMSVVAKCLRGKGCVALPIRAKNAEDIMTSPAIAVGGDATLLEITNVFREKKINRVPVVDGKGYLIGIVSRNDIIEAPQPGGVG